MTAATPASVNRTKLNPPASADTLEQAVRMTLGVMDTDRQLAQHSNIPSLAVEIWRRLARAGMGRGQGSTTDTIAAELRKLVDSTALRFGNVTPIRPLRREEILAGAGKAG